MKRNILIALFLIVAVAFSGPLLSADGNAFRRANFSNEFGIKTAEGINARGFATVRSSNKGHIVKIWVNGLLPGETYVILNHWFEPISERGIGPSGSENDPSCTGHFQFIGPLPPTGIQANKKGKIHLTRKVDHLAPHIWVANLQTFLDVTEGGTTAPQSPDAFVAGGPTLPFSDLFADEANFPDFGPLTNCNP